MNPRVLEITPIEGHKLKLLFDNGEQRFYDCSGLLDFGVFQELQDKSYFTDVTQPLPSQGRLLCHVCRLRPVAPSPAVICMLPMPFRLANLKGLREGRVVRHWVSRYARAYGTVRE